MGAMNYGVKNAKCLYPLAIEEDDSIEFLADLIDDHLETSRIDEWELKRAYSEYRVGSIDLSKSWGSDCSATVVLIVVIRLGYYQGGNLDYTIQIDDGYGVIDCADDIDFSRHSDMNTGLCSIHSANAKVFIEEAIDELADKAEAAFAKITVPYSQVAVASNGEAFYVQVN